MPRQPVPGAARWVPDDADLDTLRSAAQDCRGCELYKDTTQAVLGEGAQDARVILVGEQPGDQEDRQGHPFVGPAGRLLDKALDDVGIKRDETFVTNAVKHFRFGARGAASGASTSRPTSRTSRRAVPGSMPSSR